MSIQDVVNYYTNLLVVQYRTKPKATATIALLASEAQANGLPQELERALDLDNAIGAQLDLIGRLVGVPRLVYGLDLNHTFFSFVRYNDTTPRPGFGRYNDNPYTTSIWLRYISNSVLQMTDFEMLGCIQLKIIQNNVYTSLEAISEALWVTFGYNIGVIDGRDMTMTYMGNTQYYPILEIAQYLRILPRPMGVGVNIMEILGVVLDPDGNPVLDPDGNLTYTTP